MDLKPINVNKDPQLDEILAEVRSMASECPALVSRAEELHCLASRFAVYAEMSRAALILFSLGIRHRSTAIIDQSSAVEQQMVRELNARPIFELMQEHEIQ